jgi:hypothetical protein
VGWRLHRLLHGKQPHDEVNANKQATSRTTQQAHSEHPTTTTISDSKNIPGVPRAETD